MTVLEAINVVLELWQKEQEERHMMMFGIFGMIGELIVKLIRGNIDVFDWMVFCIWAVVAVCGAIKEAR